MDFRRQFCSLANLKLTSDTSPCLPIFQTIHIWKGITTCSNNRNLPSLFHTQRHKWNAVLCDKLFYYHFTLKWCILKWCISNSQVMSLSSIQFSHSIPCAWEWSKRQIGQKRTLRVIQYTRRCKQQKKNLLCRIDTGKDVPFLQKFQIRQLKKRCKRKKHQWQSSIRQLFWRFLYVCVQWYRASRLSRCYVVIAIQQLTFFMYQCTLFLYLAVRFDLRILATGSGFRQSVWKICDRIVTTFTYLFYA